ncbi:hypothetical protein JRO89_XS10G0135400 [Xanthoceras sorbifolium]|uniref:Uncharacterized protein n=1 Tax=Xanthoceras sorbifolium TaxID=99658 RepID=A0ABQ8HIK4_9ROSI|nr:hypothetical protein JRO89_XS10G0135400 [Xanthoceras sorbifolium]
MGSCKNNDSDSLQSLIPLNLSKTTLVASQQSQEPTSRGSTADDNNSSQRTRTRLDEEAKIEREIIKTITCGRPESLKPNSGQAIQIGDHYVCVSSHEEAESRCKVWEWHGHVVCYREESGYTQEYVYGSYFERTMSQLVYEESEEEGDHRQGGFGSRPLFAGLNLVDGSVFCGNLRDNSRR